MTSYKMLTFQAIGGGIIVSDGNSGPFPAHNIFSTVKHGVASLPRRGNLDRKMVVPARSAFFAMLGSAPVPRIRKKTRVQLTHTEKKRICEVQIDNPQWTQEKISQFVSKEFDKAIGRALVSKVLKEGEKWTSLSEKKGERTRMRPAQHVQLEDGLFMWFQQVSV